jgi:Uma2 family endonuclease
MSTITGLITVEEYERMIDEGAIGGDDHVELIEGRLVAKMPKSPPHQVGSEKTRRAIERLLPTGWHARVEGPVRIPNRLSEPEPDVSVVRGDVEDYVDRHPEPAEIALVVEVSKSSVYDDRALAPIYAAGGIPAYWILNLAGRQLEVYAGPVAGAYPAPTILDESAMVDLMIGGQLVGRIAVADLLPRRA